MAEKNGKSTKMQDFKIKELLKEYPSLKSVNGKKLIKCSITGHEMPCTENAIITYVNGKKYQRLAKDNLYCKPYYEECQEYLKSHEKLKNVLICTLTKKQINYIPSHIWKHINGKRFKRALEKAKSETVSDESHGDTDVWVPSDLDSEADGEEDIVDDNDSGSENDSNGEADDDEMNGIDDKSEEIKEMQLPVEKELTKESKRKTTLKRPLKSVTSKISKLQNSKVKRKK